MKIGSFLFVLALISLSAPAAADRISGERGGARSFTQRTKQSRLKEEIPKPELMIDIDEGMPTYLHEKPIISCFGKTDNVIGCARVSFYAAIESTHFTKNGAFRSIKLRIGLKDVEIEISSDLQKGSCPFDATLKHELTHLALHRQIVKRFAPEIAKAVLAAIESFSSPITQGHLNKIKRILSDFTEKMIQEDKKQNALMDSQDAYAHLHRQCRK